MPGLAGQSPNYRGMKIVTGHARLAAHRRRRLSAQIRANARAVERPACNLWENRSFCDIPSSCTDEHRSHFQARLPDHR
ncbi:hypothetical protein [Burkholderia pseudomallei]|uniref:hypothetical protein n=1 Tax=Burkholderia pseudomallei TaxID=28450 RepID=UPI003F65733B